MIRKIINTNEFVVLLILLVLFIVVSLINPAFFSIATLFDTLRASIVYFFLAFGLLPIIISGGVDISFVAVAAVSSYATHIFLISRGYQGGIWLYFVMASAIGILMALLMWFVVTHFNLPIFNVSLAFFTMWFGFALFFIGSASNFNLPKSAVGYYGKNLVSITLSNGVTTSLHSSIIYVILAGLFVWWFLKYTTIGRGVYAIGGSREVAVRSGFNVKLILLTIFVIMGVMAAISGVFYGLLNRFFGPMDMQGDPLNIIAAVILGGASINGGKGTVIGTALGVILIQLIDGALVVLGIPAQWQELVVGLLLVLFISIPALRAKRESRQRQPKAVAEVEQR